MALQVPEAEDVEQFVCPRFGGEFSRCDLAFSHTGQMALKDRAGTNQLAFWYA
jgi:hypothetical protein